VDAYRHLFYSQEFAVRHFQNGPAWAKIDSGPFTNVDIDYDPVFGLLHQQVVKEIVKAEIRHTVVREFPRSLGATLVSS
jgi:hypothetical protein